MHMGSSKQFYMKLPTSVFVRTLDGDALWCNPRDEISMVVQGGEILAKAMDEVGKNGDLYERIARESGLSLEMARIDFEPIVNELEKLHLLYRELNCYSYGVVADNEVAQSDSGAIDDTLRLFYLERGLPVELHIDITAACTERCKHCYLPEYPNRFLSYVLIDKVLTEFRSMQGLTVHLSGGECMLHPKFGRILRRCRELDLNVVVFSNMTLCNNEMVALLREIDPQFVNVSLYSMNSSIHDAITRVGGSWQKTMDSIRACEKAGVRIRIATPLLKINRESFVELRHFADEHNMLFVPDFNIVAKCNQDSSNLESACNTNELEEILRRNKQIFDRRWSGEMPNCDAKVCDIGVSRIYLNAMGEYYPCDAMHGYVLGNAFSDAMTSVWGGAKLNRLRELKNSHFEKCSRCDNRPWCKVCPAANYNATGDMLKVSNSCCETAKVVRRIYG